MIEYEKFGNATKNSYICENIRKMGTKEKLIKRFITQPKDFTFEEVVRLFKIFGFDLDSKGKTSGSRVLFANEQKDLSYGLHKPHPINAIKAYMMKQILNFLVVNDFINKEE